MPGLGVANRVHVEPFQWSARVCSEAPTEPTAHTSVATIRRRRTA